MGLSEDRNSRKLLVQEKSPRKPRGTRGLTKLNRELLEDGSIALWNYTNSREARRLGNQVVFLTLTIPSRFQDGSPLSQGDINRICEGWAELTKRIFEELARLQERLGIPTRWLYVVEPQENRFKERGEFCPHIHALILNRWDSAASNGRGFGRGGYRITPADTDSIWGRLLGNLLGKPVAIGAACNLGTIKGLGGLTGYLTKLGRITRYCSKGSKLLPQIVQAGYRVPSSWAGADRETRRQVRESQSVEYGLLSVQEIRDRLEQMNRDYRELLPDRSVFIGFVEVTRDGFDFPLALMGMVVFQELELGNSFLENLCRDSVEDYLERLQDRYVQTKDIYL